MTRLDNVVSSEKLPNGEYCLGIVSCFFNDDTFILVKSQYGVLRLSEREFNLMQQEIARYKAKPNLAKVKEPVVDDEDTGTPICL